jgi:membrane fusion protein (multidrug efflux system)
MNYKSKYAGMRNKMAILVFSLSALLLTSCGEKNNNAQAPPPPTVTAELVQKEAAVYYEDYPATVTALEEDDIRAQVTGYITGIFFKDGQHVVKGQKLYDIDRQQYQASLDQAIANLNVTKANLARAQQDADRYADLLKQDAIARQVYDHAMSDLQSAKMQVAAAESNVRNVQTTVKYSSISAPFSGTIGISQVKVGSLVTANQTLLNTISSDDPMAADIQVEQRQIPRFEQLKNHFSKNDSTFTLVLPGDSIYPYTGRISVIDRAVDPQTGTIKTRLIFSNPGNILRPGMDVSVRMKNRITDTSALLIPHKAVTEQMGEFFVFIVNDSSQAIQRKIILGPKINDKVVVKEGLNEGDKVITEGFQRLRDSTTVSIAQ